MSFLSDILAHPATRGLAIDDPRTTELRRHIIRGKNFLRKIYEEWYRMLVCHIPDGEGSVLEIGSGGGFFKEYYPSVIASEVFFLSHVDLVFNAVAMPFKSASFRAVLMVDVLHHIPEPVLFFREASRCVTKGGRCLLIEPWNTSWSKWVYKHLHHEPFNADGEWNMPSAGPLSGANGALPWILFERDRNLFRERFPEWQLKLIRPIMPIVYLLSGGVSLRSLIPGWMYGLVRSLETSDVRLERKCGMFAFIILEHL